MLTEIGFCFNMILTDIMHLLAHKFHRINTKIRSCFYQKLLLIVSIMWKDAPFLDTFLSYGIHYSIIMIRKAQNGLTNDSYFPKMTTYNISWSMWSMLSVHSSHVSWSSVSLGKTWLLLQHMPSTSPVHQQTRSPQQIFISFKYLQSLWS